jgi:hypothetical protein
VLRIVDPVGWPYSMDKKMNMHQDSKQDMGSNGGRLRRNIAKRLVERGQRLRSRAGVLIGMSLGLVALLSVLE